MSIHTIIKHSLNAYVAIIAAQSALILAYMVVEIRSRMRRNKK